MARYTVLLKTLLEDVNIKPLIDKALSSYPLYTSKSTNEEVQAVIPTRELLNQKLLNHYKYREIGSETIARFLDELEITMNEIMPFYNQMYKTVEIMAELPNPFDNVDVVEKTVQTRTGSGTSSDSGTTNTNDTGSSSVEGSGTNKSKVLKSETPQGNISKTASEIDSVTHADDVAWQKDENERTESTESSNTTKTTTNNQTESSSNEESELTYTKKGNQGVNTYAHDMIEFRTSIIDVTNQILEDIRIKELFMLVY